MADRPRPPWEGDDASPNEKPPLKRSLPFSAFLPREELAAAKQEIQANQCVIEELKKELCQARATMSDVIGL